MRLTRKDQRTVTVYKPLGGEECPVWGEGKVIRVCLQPANLSANSIVASIFGRRIVNMVRLFYVGKTELMAGMGVSVDVEDGAVDYEIITVSHWDTHTAALLDRLDMPPLTKGDG